MGLPAHKQTATDARLGALGTLPGGGWQVQPRAAALARLQEMGLPHRRDEYWRFTNPDTLNAPAAPEAAVFVSDEPQMFHQIDTYRLVFVDGVFDAEASEFDGASNIEISLLANDCFTNGDLAHLQQHGVAPMAWSPLAGGQIFSGAPVTLTDALRKMAEDHGVGTDAIAVAWLLAHPAKILPVMGTNNLSRIAGLSDALTVEMDRMSWFALYEAANGAEVP